MPSALRSCRRGLPGRHCHHAHGMAASALLLAACLCGAACDTGLEPPPEPDAGAIEVIVEYTGAWPPRAQLKDLRFVAMRFVPSDTADFLQLNRMAISDRLAYNVSADTVTLSDVEAGPYPYAGVAQQFAADLLAWRVVGLYAEDGGLIVVDPGRTTSISMSVDFDDPPVFPPAAE
ncbi:MAG: hypothetical protein HKN17_06410 [Rhodothermales bacterium]|nr:hypothetical protein [Rhodothermales bacterium]